MNNDVVPLDDLPVIVVEKPALVFDSLGGFYQTSLAEALKKQFQIIATPGEIINHELHNGDIYIQRIMGEGSLAQAQRVQQSDIAIRNLRPGKRLNLDALLLREISFSVNNEEFLQEFYTDVESLNTRRHWFVPYKPVVQLSRRNQVQYYVDGENYCTALYQDLLNARHHIYLTGLHFMADFGLIRSTNPWETLANILLQKAQQGIKIYLIVNQFWFQERNLLGYWDNCHQFQLFDTNTELTTQIQRAWTDNSQSSDRREQFWKELENQIRPRIAVGGRIERYLPATVDLFRQLAGQQNIKCRTDIHPGHIMHSHHQKTVVIDDQVAYVGGIDLTHLDGDRWDNNNHSTQNRFTRNRDQKYWHDIHARLAGNAAQFVTQNFHDRWRNGRLYEIQTSGLAANPRQVTIDRDQNNQTESFNAVSPVSEQVRTYSEAEIQQFSSPKVQFIRSMPEGRNYYTPRNSNWERSAKDAYIVGIKAARHSIYLENQWVSDESIWSELAQAAERNQNNPNFRIVIMLPYEPLRAAGAGANQNLLTELDILKLLIKCRNSQTLSIFSLMGSNNVPIYVHSKMMVIDDMWSLIGSANAGGISLEGIREFGILGGGNRPDTELSFITLDQTFARNLRRSTWQDHLNNSQPGNSFNQGVRIMRQHANTRNRRIRYSPYLVSAFGGIDLRVFSYSERELHQLLTTQGVQVVRQYLVSLYQINRQIDQQIRTAENALQRRIYQRIRQEAGVIISVLRNQVLRLIPEIMASV